jgi:hypothetical protein
MSTTTTTAAPDLTEEQLELRDRAREFVERVLMPLENEAEERGGALLRQTVQQIQQAAIAARLQAGGCLSSTAGRVGRCSNGSWSTSSSGG